MPTDRWTGSGPEFSLSWGGRLWRLSFDEPHPGLYWRTGLDAVKLLSLGRLARAGRVDEGAFTPETLVLLEQHRGSVRATFAPVGWGGLTVRAGWHTRAELPVVDLEIELSATTVGELEELELTVISRHGDQTGGRLVRATSALGQHDLLLASEAAGESVPPGSPARAGAATPLPQETPWPHAGPRVLAPAGSPPGWFYVEMVRPGDIAIRPGPDSGQREAPRDLAVSTRYRLFGHDLEKGVILRARVRGLWVSATAPESAALACYDDFLREPPPLSA